LRQKRPQIKGVNKTYKEAHLDYSVPKGKISRDSLPRLNYKTFDEDYGEVITSWGARSIQNSSDSYP